MTELFEQTYPNISRWVNKHGWISIDSTEANHVFLRVFNSDDIIWESESNATLSDVLQAADAAISNWMAR